MVQTQLIKPSTVYIEFETTNKSFLDMHYYLKSKGIKNNDFFLCLLDHSLAGVDPRDPNLPSTVKARVMNECRLNYWYFLRTVVRIPEQGGNSRYKLHRGNLAMNFLFTMNFNQFVEMPRQFGKTTAALVRFLWIYNFGTTNSEIMFIHKDHTGSKSNLSNLKAIRDILPTYLQMSSAVNNEGKKLKVPNTVIMIQHPYNNNKIITFPSARTKDAANNLGRGSTMPVQYYDEFAFMPYNKEVYLAATPAFSRASENAKANGAPYGMLITTTPGDLLNDSGKFAYSIRNNATPWIEDYYDKTFVELNNIKDANTNSPFFLVSYKYPQLGAGQEYFKRMVVQMNREWPAIRREVMLEWAETATDCPFSQEDLDIIKNNLKEPIQTLLFGPFGQYQFHIYEPIDTNYPPIIGVDVAGAMYHDSSAITIIDSYTTRVCATLNCNYIPTDDLAEVLYELVTKYRLYNAVINIERNGGFGISVIQRLCKTSIKKNLYWEIKDKIIEETFNGTKVIRKPSRVKVYGTDSTSAVRSRLIEILYERVMYHKDKFVAPILHAEMQAMQVKKNGKVEHSDNSHDDQVFSYLMALYVWYDGKNLVDSFHIVKNTLKTDAEEELSEAELEEQLEAREHVDLDSVTYEEIDPELEEDIEWVNKEYKTYLTDRQMKEDQILKRIQMREQTIMNNANYRKKLEEETGVDYSRMNSSVGNRFVLLPDSIYNINSIEDQMEEDKDPNLTHSYLVGNLASFYDDL